MLFVRAEREKESRSSSRKTEPKATRKNQLRCCESKNYFTARCMSSNLCSIGDPSSREKLLLVDMRRATYVLPIFGLFFAVDFLDFADLVGLLQLLLSALKQTARFDRDELHRIAGGLWWDGSCDSLLLDVICVLDGDLMETTELVFDFDNLKHFSYLSARSGTAVSIHLAFLIKLAGLMTVESFTRRVLTACIHCIRWRRHCSSTERFFLYHFRLFLLCFVSIRFRFSNS